MAKCAAQLLYGPVLVLISFLFLSLVVGVPLPVVWVSCTMETVGRVIEARREVVVEFPPARVWISAPPSSRPGQLVAAECSSSPSQPAASLSWSLTRAGRTATRDTRTKVASIMYFKSPFISCGELLSTMFCTTYVL